MSKLPHLFRQVYFLRRICLLFASFGTSISVLLLLHSVQLRPTSPSSLVCSLFYSVGFIRLNITKTSARRSRFVLYLLRGSLHNFALSPCDVFMLSIQEMTTFAIPLNIITILGRQHLQKHSPKCHVTYLFLVTLCIINTATEISCHDCGNEFTRNLDFV